MMMTTLISIILIHIILVLVGLIIQKQNSASGPASESAGSPRFCYSSSTVL